jgi:chromosome segregation ATPase
MTAMADAGITDGSSDSESPLDHGEVLALKRSLQDQRRRLTLLSADMQRQVEAREAVQAQLMEANIELAASRDRRKEMARVITNREAKVAELNAQLEARYAELAAMQRHFTRWSITWWIRILFRRLRRAVRKSFGKT